jgi:hypothetical protein
MFLWANIHSTFILGLFLFYIVACLTALRQIAIRNFGDLKMTASVTFLVTLSAMITPYGIFSFVPTWAIMGMRTLARIQEWQPPNFQQSPIHLAYLVGVLALVTSLGIKLQGPRIAILMTTAWLGLSYLRGFFILLLAIPFIFARPAAQATPYLKPQSADTDPVLHRLRGYARGICVACLIPAFAASLLLYRSGDLQPPRSAAPIAAIEYVKQAQISGHVFNSYDFGGYLIFSGIPTFIDGRAELYGDAFLRRYFETIDLVDIRDAVRLLDEYKIDWVILKPGARLVRALQDSAMWNNVYSDETSTIFLRRH